MNRKGFTMIELLAVIVVLGIVLVITFPNMTDVFKSSKLKSEEAFVERISQSIESYVTLNSSSIGFSPDEQAKKYYGGTNHIVNIYKGTITMNTIINSNIITGKDYKNPGNENVECNVNAEIEVYRDSDYVYCHKIKKDSLGCLTDEYKNTIDSDYIVDTCTWEK